VSSSWRAVQSANWAWVPLVIVLSGGLGWFLAGRALDPVNSVAEAAQKITHSNLDVQIPARNAVVVRLTRT